MIRNTILLGLVLLGGAAAAQQAPRRVPGEERESEPAPFLRTHIYQLKHSDPQHIASVLSGLYGKNGILVVPHEPTASVLVQAPAPFFDEVRELLQTLDVEEGQRPADRVMKIIPLKHRAVDKELEKILAGAFPAAGRLQSSFDPRGNAVIAAGPSVEVEALEKILAALDFPVEPGAGSTGVRVRLAWLLAGEGPGLEALRPPPRELTALLSELEKAGVAGLRLAADLSVQAVVDKPFTLDVHPRVGQDCQLRFQGTVEELRGPQALLGISIKAVAGGLGALGEISTSVRAPLGHPVVLCTSPAGEVTSVFVVEVR